MTSGRRREAVFSRNLRRDRCEFAVAKRKLDDCQSCMQWEQVLEPKLQQFLGTVRTECLALSGRGGVKAASCRPWRGRPRPCLSYALWTKVPCISFLVVGGAIGVKNLFVSRAMSSLSPSSAIFAIFTTSSTFRFVGVQQEDCREDMPRTVCRNCHKGN